MINLITELDMLFMFSQDHSLSYMHMYIISMYCMYINAMYLLCKPVLIQYYCIYYGLHSDKNGGCHLRNTVCPFNCMHIGYVMILIFVEITIIDITRNVYQYYGDSSLYAITHAFHCTYSLLGCSASHCMNIVKSENG